MDNEPFFHDTFQAAEPEPEPEPPVPEPSGIWAKLHFFKPEEFNHPDKMAPALLHRLDVARYLAGVPFVVTSDYRPGDSGAHGEGLAVDIRAHLAETRFRIVDAAIKAGFRRIGVYNLHVHLDICAARPSGLWGGVSS